MKTLKILIQSFFLFALSLPVLAQDKPNQVYVIRRTGEMGSAVNFRIFIDDVLVCKMKNKHYSIHDLKPGDHTIYVTAGGLPDERKPVPIKFTVTEGKANYFLINNGNELIASEVTQSSAEPLIAKSTQVKDCKTQK
ncbi:hypothetical protein [Pedobacter ghigonis]|uniref:hypothetical protein n=1 Tax=Pedobacter ghigonis TaxID=2730403 RepID=UPI00158E0EC2|nr:hypothetical protein [Pedobacter ghigonis]